MRMERFDVIGENIHCTRIYKTDGKFVSVTADGGAAISYHAAGGGGQRSLPVPRVFMKNADWQAGKVRHCAVAVWQGMYGAGDSAREAGRDYLRALAIRQQEAGAAYLDVNVDEFSADVGERRRAMRWVAELLTPEVAAPLSIDSSNTAVLREGLEVCGRARGRTMVNSVSLERADAIPVAAEFGAAVIASAAGEQGLPHDTAGRLANLAELIARLRAAGIDETAIYIDPLVFPIATDSNNAAAFLEAVSALRREYGPAVHIVGGFSNVSFGMPCRPLINRVFTRLAVDAGADGGIVDPFQIGRATLEELDVASEGFGLARALLMGEDAFGVGFIAAHRDGRLREGA